jgi:hypothetical protein
LQLTIVPATSEVTPHYVMEGQSNLPGCHHRQLPSLCRRANLG